MGDQFLHLPTSPASYEDPSSKLRVHRLFDIWIEQVNKLLKYPYWLPIQRCQVTFYSEKLRSSLQAFPSFTLTGDPNSPDLSLFELKVTNYSINSPSIFKIDKYTTEGGRLSLFEEEVTNYSMNPTSVFEIDKYTTEGGRLDFEKPNEPPDLNCVGDRLVLQVAEIYQLCMQVFGKTKDFNSPDPDFASQFYFDKKKFQKQLDEEVFVGFQEEASYLLKKLASITRRRLEVISIVGMAGLGKTTLARRLFNDPYLVSYFYVRACVTCSQDYRKRNLLLGILRSVVEITDEIFRMNDNMLAQELYRALMGQRYLIVIDDIWSRKAWDDLKICFPDDKNGSKIMLTTRLKDVALHAQSDGDPFCLRFLTEEESFELLRRKAYVTDNFFDYLTFIGKSITKKCRGLPLAIVVIAGILQNNLKMTWWLKVAKSVGSYILTDLNQYMDTLEVSYNHLPTHLRPCFLYFGAFPEDHEVPVSKLFWLWIAEGFICHFGTEKRLEDVAKDYLMDLVSRSLVVVGKKGSSGTIKTCRIHDLLRDLCLRKVKEENFSQNIHYNKHSYICHHSSTSPLKKPQLLLNTNVPTISSKCSCYSVEVSYSFFKDVSILWNTSRPIRALNISSIEFFVFPNELLQLVQLRYLELRFRSGNPPESISHLKELQTLIMSSRMNMVVPNNMWKMIKLRHLCIKSGENLVNISNVEEPSSLENLQTMSLVCPTRQCQHILARSHNLLNLGFCGSLTTKGGELKFPDIGFLMHLETLKLLNTVPLFRAGRLSDSILFPESLRTVSFSNTYLDWKEAWVFEMIPKLEVLKLKLHAFVGKDWKTSPEAFRRLKILKLDELDIVTWTASRNHFPVLQRLQVYRCPCLMEIPDDFGNICTLEWIELSGCSDAATESARDIQKEQESNGNDWLKILLNPGLIST